MISKKELFFRHLAQTSDAPLALEIEKAEGVYLYTPAGMKIIDLISGVSVNNVGHCHPKVVQAIREQAERYMHIMVYGEVIQSPQVILAEQLAAMLPESLSSVYFVNSGSEANEGALKLAKKFTGRSGIISFTNAYHGSTHGCLSIIGGDYYQHGYQPLLPDTRRLQFNDPEGISQITPDTAAVIMEVIQGEGGILAADFDYLGQIRARCFETGTVLIFDEVQTGFGRTGKMFAFEHYGVIPDILTLAKGMGGGMPIGAFIASDDIMRVLRNNPALGHITTFGGHPVSAAAAIASLGVISEPGFLEEVIRKGLRFKTMLINHPAVEEIRQHGLMIAVKTKPGVSVQQFILKGLENGFMSDWFLFCDNAFRIAPPLTITDNETDEAVRLVRQTLDAFIHP
ncbi:MAG: aspartate aminotransferase family protein [Bacteroidales bacterium]